MDRFARVVLGYHGCESQLADDLLTGKIEVKDWKSSSNPWDWLGHGIYFWEHAPERARSWATASGKTGVIGAVIQLGRCLDFTDTQHTDLLKLQYDDIASLFKKEKLKLPENKDKRRNLDCFVINEIIRMRKSIKNRDRFQTVRCPFLEGEQAFPNSGILKESHVQISVIDRECILGVFRPNLDEREEI